MAVLDALYTRADYDRLPEGFPAELVEGCLVKEPAPRFDHGRAGARLRAILQELVGIDRLPLTPCDVAVDDHNVYQPDIVVLSEADLARLERERRAGRHTSYVGTPLLAIEILSPATAARDRDVKAAHLLRAGVGEVWLVDPDARTIDVCRRGAAPARVADADEARSGVVPGFAVVPRDLFDDRSR